MIVPRFTTFDVVPLAYACAATGIAGWIAGNSICYYLLAALTVLSIRWFLFFRLHRTATYAFTFDPDKPRGLPFLQALQHLFQTALKTGLPFRIRLHHFRTNARYAPTFELIQNDVALTHCVERKANLNQPGIWIAEHPLPLTLPARQALTLRFSPTRDHRIRVAAEKHTFAYTPILILPLILAASIACFLDCNALLAVTLGAAFASLLK